MSSYAHLFIYISLQSFYVSKVDCPDTSRIQKTLRDPVWILFPCWMIGPQFFSYKIKKEEKKKRNMLTDDFFSSFPISCHDVASLSSTWYPLNQERLWGRERLQPRGKHALSIWPSHRDSLVRQRWGIRKHNFRRQFKIPNAAEARIYFHYNSLALLDVRKIN